MPHCFKNFNLRNQIHRKQQLFSIMNSNKEIFWFISPINESWNYCRFGKNLHMEFISGLTEFIILYHGILEAINQLTFF